MESNIVKVLLFREFHDLMIDLHLHSTCSDGLDTPTQLIDKASKLNLKAIALTDHDSIDGIQEFLNYGEEILLQSNFILGFGSTSVKIKVGGELFEFNTYLFGPFFLGGIS